MVDRKFDRRTFLAEGAVLLGTACAPNPTQNSKISVTETASGYPFALPDQRGSGILALANNEPSGSRGIIQINLRPLVRSTDENFAFTAGLSSPYPPVGLYYWMIFHPETKLWTIGNRIGLSTEKTHRDEVQLEQGFERTQPHTLNFPYINWQFVRTAITFDNQSPQRLV